MESPQPILSSVALGVGVEVPAAAAAPKGNDDTGAFLSVDPFLVEALENPRHRLTVLRMEFEIQRFIRSPGQQFEFQRFPTSYLRRAAHRVAQHYGLRTALLDNFIDGAGRIVAMKADGSKFPTVLLSDIPPKLPENEECGPVKFVIRQRPNKAFQNGTDELGAKLSTVRTMEEREEEYDRARARIFNGSNTELECTVHISGEGKCLNTNRNANVDYLRLSTEEPEKTGFRDGTSRVAAIFRDREKDRVDPDYNRSYDRYSRAIMPNQAFNLALPYNVLQPPFFMGSLQSSHVPWAQSSLSCCPPSHVSPSYFSAYSDQISGDAAYMQWPSPAMMCEQSYEHLRRTPFPVPSTSRP